MKIKWKLEAVARNTRKEWVLYDKSGAKTSWSIGHCPFGDKNWLIYHLDGYEGEHRHVAGAKKIAEALFQAATGGFK